MSDVTIFYGALNAASSAISDKSWAVTTSFVGFDTDDVGIKNPASRPTLRLEVRNRMMALRGSAQRRMEASAELSAAIHAIATKYTDLDHELNGAD